MSQRILIVCRGNLCRSPMAEALMRHRASGLAVTSAGLAAIEGSDMDPAARRALAAHGLDAQAHVARQVTLAAIERADLVLAMEQRHIAALIALSPAVRSKAYLLSRWSDKLDIDDPFGRSQDAFDRSCTIIASAVDAWLAKLD